MADDNRELFCILVPLASGKLVLPRSIVEEVRSLGDPESVDGMPPWLTGLVRWRGDRIPLVAIEPLLGLPLTEHSRRSRMIIVRTPAGALKPAVMAILAQGFPYILRVTPQLLSAAEQVDGESMLARVTLGMEHPVIPDLPALATEAGRLLAA